jgi:DNA-binding NtrC family response regulator
MAPQLVFGIDDFHAKAGPAYHSRVADFTAARDRMEVLAGSETILLVEDSESCRRLLRMLLECSGYAVLEAAGGPEAAQIAANHRGAIHLLLTDVIMPQISGYRLSEHLRFLRPEMKVLCMSGYTDCADIVPNEPNPGIALLAKPFSRDALLVMVRQILDEPQWQVNPDAPKVDGAEGNASGSRHKGVGR